MLKLSDCPLAQILFVKQGLLEFGRSNVWHIEAYRWTSSVCLFTSVPFPCSFVARNEVWSFFVAVTFPVSQCPRPQRCLLQSPLARHPTNSSKLFQKTTTSEMAAATALESEIICCILSPFCWISETLYFEHIKVWFSSRSRERQCSGFVKILKHWNMKGIQNVHILDTVPPICDCDYGVLV